MSKSLASIVILLVPLTLLGACIEVAPRSSVAFQPSAEREVRYAAELALAIKEDRRDAVSEAAVNGRLVLPHMPEIWGVPPTEHPGAASGQETALLEPGVAEAGAAAGGVPSTTGCEGLWADADDPDVCPSGGPGLEPALPVLSPAAIAPAAAPLGTKGKAARLHRYQLYFERGSARLDARAQRVLESVVGSALLLQPRRIIVTRPASGGVAADHRTLPGRRAAMVVEALIRAGIPAERIETRTLGGSSPPARDPDRPAVEITLA
jgi:hypothetical protein